MSLLTEFAQSLATATPAEDLRAGLIGEGALIDGPNGPVPLVYADYTASGRALGQVEDFIRHRVLPFYANSHTEASYCGAFTTQLREEARGQIARMSGAGAGCHVIFAGSGATGGLNRVVGLLDIPGVLAAGGRAVVLVGPYEHHSNLLPWRESGAEVVEIPEAAHGGPDMAALEAALVAARGAELVVGAFSAASNVTGILTDTDAVTRMLKVHGALAVWDYAAGAPYIAMDMGTGAAAKDAIVFSAHKFAGGPGASGVVVLRDTVVRRATPTLPGGGTVAFVSPWGHDYSPDVAHREEGGTPNILGDIRAALVMLVKEALGQGWLDARHAALRAQAQEVWGGDNRIELLGQPQAPALPILSFRLHDGQGRLVHHQLVTRLLSDLYGIQTRGGCACAGSYGHRLLGIDRAQSDAMRAAILQGAEIEKLGWVRLNLSALATPEKVAYILTSVQDLAARIDVLAKGYEACPQTGQFLPRAA